MLIALNEYLTGTDDPKSLSAMIATGRECEALGCGVDIVVPFSRLAQMDAVLPREWGIWSKWTDAYPQDIYQYESMIHMGVGAQEALGGKTPRRPRFGLECETYQTKQTTRVSQKGLTALMSRIAGLADEIICYPFIYAWGRFTMQNAILFAASERRARFVDTEIARPFDRYLGKTVAQNIQPPPPFDAHGSWDQRCIDLRKALGRKQLSIIYPNNDRGWTSYWPVNKVKQPIQAMFNNPNADAYFDPGAHQWEAGVQMVREATAQEIA